MKRAGILIHSFNPSQKITFMVNALNTLSADKPDISYIVFREDFGPLPTIANFPIMESFQAWGFDGVLIATDLHTARILKGTCTKETKKFFYCFDLEWLYLDNLYYGSIAELYNMQLIARSDEHYDILSKCWRKPTIIMPDFDINSLVTLAYLGD